MYIANNCDARTHSPQQQNFNFPSLQCMGILENPSMCTRSVLSTLPRQIITFTKTQIKWLFDNTIFEQAARDTRAGPIGLGLGETMADHVSVSGVGRRGE